MARRAGSVTPSHNVNPRRVFHGIDLGITEIISQLSGRHASSPAQPGSVSVRRDIVHNPHVLTTKEKSGMPYPMLMSLLTDPTSP